MEIGNLGAAASRAGHPPEGSSRAVIWHDLECGGYRADLTLWLELAARGGPGSSILDVGAGTGRVTLALARAGYDVTALDIDPGLLDGLSQRVGETAVETICADARSFSLEREDFSACFIPMQTIQLLGDHDERMKFLRSARAHLCPGGLLACAIVTAVEPFDCSNGQPAPASETTEHGGMVYVSRPTRVAVNSRSIVIERERRIFPAGVSGPARAGASESHFIEHEVAELAALTVAELQDEGTEAALEPLDTLHISPTAEHVGSEVVVFGA